MKIGIVSVDLLIPNVALMQLSAWHKAHGDQVKLYEPLWDDPDLIYASKIFDFSDDYAYFPDGCEIVRGGTGYSLDSRLPDGVDRQYPDYELLGCDFAIGRVSRGCIRRCPWCVVWKQDGKVRQVGTLDDFWRGQTHLRLLDDNLTALPDLFVEVCDELARLKVRTMFEALDIRLMTVETAQALAKVKRWGQVHFAFDTPAIEAGVRRGIAALKEGGFPLWAATFYVLIGFNTTPDEDLYRVELLRSLGVESFAMPFDKSDPYQRRFARWVNHKAIFKTVKWEDYDHAARFRK